MSALWLLSRCGVYAHSESKQADAQHPLKLCRKGILCKQYEDIGTRAATRHACERACNTALYAYWNVIGSKEYAGFEFGRCRCCPGIVDDADKLVLAAGYNLYFNSSVSQCPSRSTLDTIDPSIRNPIGMLAKLGLSHADIAHIAAFVSQLRSAEVNKCSAASQSVVRDLTRHLREENLTIREEWLRREHADQWLSLRHSDALPAWPLLSHTDSPSIYSRSFHLRHNRGTATRATNLSETDACDDLSRYWVKGPGVSWRATPSFAHCCNKGASLGRCPLPLIETPSKCKHDYLRALRGECEDATYQLCLPYTRFPTRHAPHRDCLVYSFGIGGEWGFEEWAGQKGCEVHAFDPTEQLLARHQQHHAPNVTFHYMGLGGNEALHNFTSGYGTLGGPLHPLDTIISKLGHGLDRPVGLLKIDCEGCEWEVLTDPDSWHAFTNVCSILLEVHFTPALQMASPRALERVAAFWRYFVLNLGFRFWHIHPNPGGPQDRQSHPALVELGLHPNVCCYEISLHNPRCAVEA